MATYTVKKGDTLSRIARRLGLPSYQALAAINNISDPNRISIGQVLQTDSAAAPAAPTGGTVQSVERHAIMNPDGTRGPQSQATTDANAQSKALLAADPAYQAFLRSSGLHEAQLRDEIQYRIDTTNKQINRRAAGYEDQKSDATRDIGRGYDARGLYQSGARMADQADASADVDRQRLEAEATQRDSLEQQQRGLDAQINALARSRAEEEVAARGRAFEKTALGNI